MFEGTFLDPPRWAKQQSTVTSRQEVQVFQIAVMSFKRGDLSLTLLQSYSLAILSNFVKKTTNETLSFIPAEIQELNKVRSR